MNVQKYIIIFMLFLLSFSCENDNKVKFRFGEGAKKIQQEVAPDRSLKVFEADLIRRDGKWVLTGETSIPAARDRIIALADSLLGRGIYEEDFTELPQPSLGDSTYGIITVSVAHLRDTPSLAAQMIDQEIMGYVVRLMKKERGWYLVQTEYDYLGWMRGESFRRTDAEGAKTWKENRKVKVTELYPMIYSRADASSEPVSDAVLNMLLKLEQNGPAWTKVSLPDGRSGYIRTSAVSLGRDKKKSREELTRDIIHTARMMMGVSYLWGGNSSKNNDCSGFTQNVFRANGIDIPRDARQQVLVGSDVIYDKTFSSVNPGDLLFFGSEDRITHVGISLGGPEFIHQSGMVQINSLDSTAADFSAYRLHGLRKIKRVF